MGRSLSMLLITITPCFGCCWFITDAVPAPIDVLPINAVNRLDRKMVSSAFYWHEIECEIMERNLDWYFKGKLEDARDEFMNFIESERRTENYAHPVKDCSQMCKERGIVISTN